MAGTIIQDAAGRQKILEGLWLIGIEPSQITADPNLDSNAFLDQLHKSGVNDDFIRRAISGVDWRASGSSPLSQKVADLLRTSGYRTDEVQRFLDSARGAGDSPTGLLGVLSQQFNNRTAGAMIFKATGGQDVQGAVWNPYRTDIAPKNADVATYAGRNTTGYGSAELPIPPTPRQQGAQVAAQAAAAKVAPKRVVGTDAGRLGGGGGGGGGGGVDTTPRLAPNASPADALAFIREHYGYGAWIFDQPDVANILTAAAKDGHWSDARLTGALMATDFFKKNTGTTINWMNTESNDPATAKAQVDAEVNTVIGKAQTLGMDLDPGRARQIATDSKRFGWDDTQLTKAVGHEYHYNPTMAQKGIAKTIRDTARTYGIPMTDGGLDEWGRKVASGDASADDFKATMINQAKSLFPTLAGDLDRGATVKDIFDPYAKLAATTLGIDENSIDILDPKWQRPLQSTDGKNPTRMSTSDWHNTLRTDAQYGFDTTDNARQEAADFAHKIRAGFGLA